MITGVKKISVFDPATGTTVQLNSIVPQADAKIKSPIEILDVDNELFYDGDDSFLEFASFDLTGYDQLEDWMIANTKVQLVVAGYDYHILWYESATITVKKTFGFKTGNRNLFTVRISKGRGTHTIYALTNLLRSNGRWLDVTSLKTDMLTFSGASGVVYDFASQIQTVDMTGSGGLETVTGTLIYPFSGISMISVLNRVSGGNWTIRLLALNFAGGTLATSSSTINDFVILSLPLGTYKIQWKLNEGDGDIVTFKHPFLGAERGNYNFINY